MGRTQFSILFILLLSAAPGPQNWSEPDRFLDMHLSRFNLPGAAAPIVRRYSLAHTRTGDDRPDPDRSYYLASLSKSRGAMLNLLKTDPSYRGSPGPVALFRYEPHEPDRTPAGYGLEDRRKHIRRLPGALSRSQPGTVGRGDLTHRSVLAKPGIQHLIV